MSNIEINVIHQTETSKAITKTPVEIVTFSDGTETVKLSEFLMQVVVEEVFVKITQENCTLDLIRLGLVADALDRLGIKKRTLDLRYISQARADRVFTKTSPLPVKLFADILNSYNYTKVIVEDPHSDVSVALINNVQIRNQTECLRSVLVQGLGGRILCAPDLGATKKIFDTVMDFGVDKYIQAVKIRDVRTGEIIKCDVVDEVPQGSTILIVDDISDGGASFKFLAQTLKEKGAEKVELYVTHGIFPKGLDNLKGTIDTVYIKNIVGGYITRQDIKDFNKGVGFE